MSSYIMFFSPCIELEVAEADEAAQVETEKGGAGVEQHCPRASWEDSHVWGNASDGEGG